MMPRSIAEAAAAIRDGTQSSTSLTVAMLARADQLDDQIGAFTSRSSEAALEAAGLADRELADGVDRGPLHGIPIGIKDIVDVRGSRTSAQSRLQQDEPPCDHDAEVVSRLRTAGAVVVGKTTTMEFAIGLPDVTAPFPIPRNPWRMTAWTGGSSSGCASGIAAGFFLGAVGTDTGGSIRNPAALCGVTGFKPTFGRVPIQGVVPLAPSMDHVGPMATTAADCGTLFRAMIRAHDPSVGVLNPSGPEGEWSRVRATDARVGVLRAPHAGNQLVDPSAVAAFDEALVSLGGLGLRVEEVTLADLDLAAAAGTVLNLVEAFETHKGRLQTNWDRYGSATRLALSLGAFYDDSDRERAGAVLRRLGRRLIEQVNEFDAVVALTAGAGAPDLDTLSFASGMSMPFFTHVWSSLGLPAISIPIGYTASGLPVGMQIIAGPFRDANVLQLAEAFQTVTTWHSDRPSLGE